MTRTRTTGVVVIAALALASACTSHDSAAKPNSSPQPITGPGVYLPTAHACTTVLTTATSAAPTAKPAGDLLPDLRLPCLTGAASELNLKTIGGRPTVITLWASWCGPCRKELPAFQRLADGGKVGVLGIDTEDDASSGVGLLKELKVGFASLWDFPGKTLRALPKVRVALPVTVFVRADGSIAKVYQAEGFDEASLKAAVQTYLGVAT